MTELEKQLFEACKAQHDAIDILLAMLVKRDRNFFPSMSGKPWAAAQLGNEAIKAAEKQ